MMKLIRNATMLALVLALSSSLSVAGDQQSSTTTKSAVTEDSSTEGIKWLTYDEGIAKAKETGRPIVIDFYTNWCGYCKKMDREAFHDPDVINYMNEKFIPVRVNGESKNMVSHKGEQLSERSLTQAYRVRGFPTFWFLDAEGEPIGPAPGYKPIKSWMILLEYVGETHYKKMSYESYVKSKSSDG